MKYFAHATINVNPKNKAQEQVQQYCLQVDGTLFPDESAMEQFIELFRDKINELNRQFPRCQDMSFSKLFYLAMNTRAIYVDENVCIVSFYEVKREA